MANSPFKPGAPLIAYLRDSGGDEQDLSIAQQKNHLQTWAEENNLAISTWFIDEARTGSTTSGRVAFYQMLQHLNNPNCKDQGVLLWSFARFSRDIDDAQYFKADIRRQGYEIFAITDPVPPGLDGRFFEAALDWSNTRRLIELQKETKRGLHYILQQYGALGGTPPFGFKRTPIEIGIRRDGTPHVLHRWDPDPDIIPQAQKAFELRASGHTYPQINDQLHIFRSTNSYTTFFRNKLFIGILEFDGQEIAYGEPVIDKNIWEAVQMRHQNHKTKQTITHPRRASSSYLLSGLAYCGYCQAPLNGHTIVSKKYRTSNYYYKCSQAKRTDRCQALALPRQVVEDQVLFTLKNFILMPENLSDIQKTLTATQSSAEDLQSERNRLTRVLGPINQKIQNIIDAIAENGHTPDMLKNLNSLDTQKQDLSLQIKRIDHQINHPIEIQTTENIEKLSKDLIKTLNTSSREQLKTLLNILIHKILIKRDQDLVTGQILYFAPEGASYAYGQYPHGESNPGFSLERAAS